MNMQGRATRHAHRRAALVTAATLALPLGAAAQSCSAQATAINFGMHNPMAPTPNDTSATVSLSCSVHAVALLLSYTISLSAGSSANFAQRKMTAGSRELAYQLYSNSQRTAVWGDGSAGTGAVHGGLTLSLLSGTVAARTVYGRIPAPQPQVAPGSYGDVVTVTISF